MNALVFKIFILFSTSIYDLGFLSIDGTTVNFSSFKNKQILIVNTAANSKYANQYGSLEVLYQKYKDSLIVIAFPSNDFGNESRSNFDILNSVDSTYNIHYILASKVSVLNAGISPVFKWLTSSALNGVIENVVPGDFTKFLIDSKGNIRGVFSGSVDPMSVQIQNAITN